MASSSHGKQLEEKLRETGDNDFEAWGGDFVKVQKLRSRLTLRKRKTTKGSDGQPKDEQVKPAADPVKTEEEA